MSPKSAYTIAALLFAAAPVSAETPAPFTPAPLSYAQFEAAVPHMDLDKCPAALAQENTFCRVTLRHDEIHVFVFSEADDSPMIGFKSYPADGLTGLLQ